MKSKFQFKFCRSFWLFFQGVRWQPQFQASCPIQQYPMVGRVEFLKGSLSLSGRNLPHRSFKQILPTVSLARTLHRSHFKPITSKRKWTFLVKKKKLSRIPGFRSTEMELSTFYPIALTNYNKKPCTGCIMQVSWDSDKHWLNNTRHLEGKSNPEEQPKWQWISWLFPFHISQFRLLGSPNPGIAQQV